MAVADSTLKFGRKQAFYNMASQGLAFGVNLLLGFFLTPFVVKHIGSTANGFFVLASNITSYAALVVIALNSMAGRFIAMAYFQKRMEEVQRYYSSVFIANIVICLLLSIPAIVLLFYLPDVFQIPEDLFKDVTILFILTFLQFAIIQIGGAFNNSAYVVNRLELVASRNIESKILCVALIFSIFIFFAPHLWQLGAAHLISTIYGVLRNYQIHRRVMPEVKIKRKYFEFAKVRELFFSGIWNSISSLGSILLDQLDLLIVNMFISAAAMGVLSVAKVLPLCISGLICSLASSVAPTLTKEFAEGNMAKIGQSVHFNMRLMGYFICIPTAYMAIFGVEFYRLWVPSMEAWDLWWISLAAFAVMPISLALSPMGLVFTSANKVKVNSLMTIGYALLSLGVMFGLLRLTDDTMLKMLIVVGVSKFFGILQGCTFTIPYVARLLAIRSWPFYKVLLKNVGVTIVTVGVCWGVRHIFPVHSWLTAIIAGVLTGIIGTVFCWMTLFNHEEKNVLILFVKTRLHIG